MADFAGHARGAFDQAAVHDDPAAHAGTERIADDARDAATRTAPGFAKRGDVGVVVDAHRFIERRLQMILERNVAQERQIRGEFDEAPFEIDESGDADAYAGDLLPGAERIRHDAAHVSGDIVQHPLRALIRFGRPLIRMQKIAVAVANADFDRGPTDIHAYVNVIRHFQAHLK